MKDLNTIKKENAAFSPKPKVKVNKSFYVIKGTLTNKEK